MRLTLLELHSRLCHWLSLRPLINHFTSLHPSLHL